MKKMKRFSLSNLQLYEFYLFTYDFQTAIVIWQRGIVRDGKIHLHASSSLLCFLSFHNTLISSSKLFRCSFSIIVRKPMRARRKPVFRCEKLVEIHSSYSFIVSFLCSLLKFWTKAIPLILWERFSSSRAQPPALSRWLLCLAWLPPFSSRRRSPRSSLVSPPASPLCM